MADWLRSGWCPTTRCRPSREQPRVKVLHVITRFAGGSGGNTLLSAAGMDPERYETWVASMPGGPLWDAAEAAGVRTTYVRHMREQISPWHDLLACRELVRLMRRERFTVVHTHCSKAGLIGRVAARLAGAPVVVHTFHIFAVHDGLSPVRKRLYLLLDRAVRSLADRYVAVAPSVAREAVEQRVVGPGRDRRGPLGGGARRHPDRAGPRGARRARARPEAARGRHGRPDRRAEVPARLRAHVRAGAREAPGRAVRDGR